MQAYRDHHPFIKATSPRWLSKRLLATPHTSSSLQHCVPRLCAAPTAPQPHPPSKAMFPRPAYTQPTALGRPLRWCPNRWGHCSAPPCYLGRKSHPAILIHQSCYSPGWKLNLPWSQRAHPRGSGISWLPSRCASSPRRMFSKDPIPSPPYRLPLSKSSSATTRSWSSATSSSSHHSNYHLLRLCHLHPSSSHSHLCLHPNIWLLVSMRALLGLPVPRMWT